MKTWLCLSRGTRATLRGHLARFHPMDQRFDRIDRRLDDLHLLDREESRARQQRMDERRAEIERRLGRLEETTET